MKTFHNERCPFFMTGFQNSHEQRRSFSVKKKAFSLAAVLNVALFLTSAKINQNIRILSLHSQINFDILLSLVTSQRRLA